MRNFLGGFDSSRFGKKDKQTPTDYKRLKAGGHQKDDYQEMIQKRIEEYKAQMMREATSGASVHLPGTDPNQTQELSKTAQMALETIAMKKARKEAKKARGKPFLQSRNIGSHGGRMDDKGNVYTGDGRMVLTIDPKTGDVRNNLGVKVGKYKADSSFSMYQLERLIDKEQQKKPFGRPLKGK